MRFSLSSDMRSFMGPFRKYKATQTQKSSSHEKKWVWHNMPACLVFVSRVRMPALFCQVLSLSRVHARMISILWARVLIPPFRIVTRVYKKCPHVKVSCYYNTIPVSIRIGSRIGTENFEKYRDRINFYAPNCSRSRSSNPPLIYVKRSASVRKRSSK